MKTVLPILLFCLGYGAVVVTVTLALKSKLADGYDAQFVFNTLGVVTFVIAVTALFKPTKQ